MNSIRLAILLLAASVCVCILAIAQESPTASASASRAIGTVTAINGNSVTLKTDSGTETTVTVPDTARIVKAEPGQKDLRNATPIHLQDVQVGDRALVRGKAGENNALEATSMIVMKQSDVASRQQQEIQEWQRRGAGGIVRSVDPSSGTITISTGPNQTLAIQTSANTLFLCYAPDSVKFSDAKKSSINDIKPGDQLRARGNRSADGQQLTADAVISGSFRNIAGTLSSIDVSANSLNVADLITKKPVVVKITPDTQLRKIPPEMAQRIAFFLRRSSGQGGPSSEGQSADPGANSGASAQAGPRPGGFGPAAGVPGGGRPDFQQIIRRMPSATINDLQKGDAVMIVTTMGAPGEPVTALTLLSGVEPILTAAPTQTSANLLSGWSMGGGEGENQ